MKTFVIGDIHGCFDELLSLLKLVDFNEQEDNLWLTGDIINGGPKPIETLDFLLELKNKPIMVLGNHELTLLGVYYKKLNLSEKQIKGFLPILNHHKRATYIEWLQHLPLAHYDAKFDALLVHAGIAPQWSVTELLSYAKEVEDILRGPLALELYQNMFGNQPDQWQDTLTGWDRMRFIINALTRIRFCRIDGKLDLTTKGNIGEQPKDYFAWFELAKKIPDATKVFFGHWASLNGQTNSNKFIGMDTGCMWGNKLSAYCIEDNKIYFVPCLKQYGN